MANGQLCKCGSIPRLHLDYECALKRLDPVLFYDGWNSDEAFKKVDYKVKSND